ncbi:5226_t:CDS:2, partial [Ambispora leptoticha]
PPTATLAEFNAQLQALLANNGAELISSSNANDYTGFTNLWSDEAASSLDNTTIFTPEMLSLSSPESFAQIHSPNSYTTGDDYESLPAMSPPSFNNLSEFANPTDQIASEFAYPCLDEPFDQLLPTKMEFTATISQTENARKRQTIGGDVIFDEDDERENFDNIRNKKQRNSNAGRSTKKSTLNNNDILISSLSKKKQLVKDEPVDQTSTTANSFAQGLAVPIMCLPDGTAANLNGTQSILVPSSSPTVNPAQLSNNFNASTLLTFGQGVWSGATTTTHPVSSQSNYVQTLNPTALQDGTSLSLPSREETNNTTAIGSNQNTSNSSSATATANANNNAATKLPITQRRYRNNINDRINDLKNVVPALCHLKTTILRKATEYINYLKKSNQQLKVENDILKKIVEILPGGVELYHKYFDTPVGDDSGSGDIRSPRNKPEPIESDTRNGNTSPRALMALFMFVTFFTSPSQYGQSDNGHNHSIESHQHAPARALGLSSNENIVESSATTGFSANDGTLTIDVWYLARIFTCLLCLIYILRPSLFSNHPPRAHNSKQTVMSVLAAKSKNTKELHRSISRMISPYPTNIMGFFFGFVTELFQLLTRRILGWGIFRGAFCRDIDSEISLWGRLGEVELCGGNEKVSRFSILYTAFRTVNLLEAANFIFSNNSGPCAPNPSRIYANAAIQCYIGFSSFPYIARKTAAHFWQKAIANKGYNGAEEKWLEVALTCNQNGDIWKGVVNQIAELAFQKGQISKSSDEEEITTLITPLCKISDAQALFRLKETYYNFISEQYGRKRSSNKKGYSFAELMRVSSPSSLAHWYTLVGYALATFARKQNNTGLNIINQLKLFTKKENNNNKQIIEMGLLSYALLMYGKIEASARFADSAYVAIIKGIQEKNADDCEEETNEFCKLKQEIHDLAEFCVGRIVLEGRILIWKIIEELSSQNKDVPIPDVLDIEARLKPGVQQWLLYLRRLANNEVFDGIAKTRRESLKHLHTLTHVVSGQMDIGFEDNEKGKIEKRGARTWQALKSLAVNI